MEYLNHEFKNKILFLNGQKLSGACDSKTMVCINSYIGIKFRRK
jgi:hypothetical protein